MFLMLCLILFLHQTTTTFCNSSNCLRLCLILFLHQTTTHYCARWTYTSCVLFYFYIKPQQGCNLIYPSTGCVLFYFYIKPQRTNHCILVSQRCVLFYFYIKPQLVEGRAQLMRVVSYSISTSNHNQHTLICILSVLCLILFLHQTTTYRLEWVYTRGCVLFYFYIKPQLCALLDGIDTRCVLFYFYIKPQLTQVALW